MRTVKIITFSAIIQLMLFVPSVNRSPVFADQLEGPSLAVLLRIPYPDQIRLVDLYKPYITGNDYVITFLGSENLEFASLLPGMRTVTYASVAAIEENAASLRGKVDYVAYDIEHSLSPDIDMQDPVGSVKRASQIVHDNGFRFMLAPSGKVTDRYGPAFAPFVDVYVLQYQAYQKEPSLYESKVIAMAGKLKQLNPSIKVITQVSTLRGSVSNMIDTFSLVSRHVDGVTIFYGLTNTDIKMMKEFLEFVDGLRKSTLTEPGSRPSAMASILNVGLLDSSGHAVSKVKRGVPVFVNPEVKNNTQETLNFTILVKINNKEAVTVHLSSVKGLDVLPGTNIRPSQSWIPEEADEYTLEVFVWDGLDNPSPLASAKSIWTMVTP